MIMIDLLFFILFAGSAIFFHLHSTWQIDYHWCIYIYFCIVGINLVALALRLTGKFFYINFLISYLLTMKLIMMLNEGDKDIAITIIATNAVMGALMAISRAIHEQASVWSKSVWSKLWTLKKP
jgi:hypothetical protein